jgi:hypothetical protein
MLARQTWKGDLSVWLLDDGSDEHLDEMKGWGLHYLKLRDAGSAPRSSNMAYRAGYEACDADFIILTHPEYLVPESSVETLVQRYDGVHRIGHSPIAIPRKVQRDLDQWNWRDPDSLMNIPGIVTEHSPWGWTNAYGKEWCHHLVFSGQNRAGWDRLGFLPATEERGYNDSWLLPLEIEHGFPPVCSGLSGYHQWHERLFQDGKPVGLVKRSVRVARIAP